MLTEEQKKAHEEALKMIKEVYDDKVATVNGHDYHFLKLTHDKRLKVFGFMTSVKEKIASSNFDFLGTDKWKEIERIIQNSITYDDNLLSKLKDHWDNEEFMGDYITLMLTSLQVISYPLSKSS